MVQVGRDERVEGSDSAGAAADRLPHLSALALAGLLVVLLRLERLQDTLALQHAFKAPQRLLKRLVTSNFYAWHSGLLINTYYKVGSADCQPR